MKPFVIWGLRGTDKTKQNKEDNTKGIKLPWAELEHTKDSRFLA